MGLDYIRRETGKPWRKQWDGGLDRMKQPSLLDLQIEETARTFTVDIRPGTAKAGSTLIAQCDGSNIVLSDGLHPVAVWREPPSDVCAAINEEGGYAEAVVERVGLFGDTAEVRLK